MANPKLFTLIKALDVKQLNSLKKYMAFKTGIETDHYRLFEYFLKEKEVLEFPPLTTIVNLVFPKYSEKTISNYISVLYLWAEEWMAVDQMTEDLHTKDLLAQKWLSRKGLYGLANQNINKLCKTINESKTIDIQHEKAKVEMFFERHFSNNPIKHDLAEDSLIEIVNSFECFFKTMYLLLITEMYNWGSIINFDFSSHIEKGLKVIGNMGNGTLSETAQTVLNLIEHNDVKALQKLSQRLVRGDYRGGKLEFIVSTYATKQAAALWTKGLSKDKNLIVELTNYALDAGLYFNNGMIPPAKFHNLIMNLNITYSFDEMTQFIEKWIDKVNTKNVEATKALAMAQTCLYKQRFEEIHKYVWRSNFDTFSQKNTAQGIYLISVFMNRKKEPVFYKNTLNASIKFIQRNKNKMSPHIYFSYVNLLDFMQKVDHSTINNIVLEEYKPLLYRSWCEYIINKKK